jgi:hypothetical protein
VPRDRRISHAHHGSAALGSTLEGVAAIEAGDLLCTATDCATPRALGTLLAVAYPQGSPRRGHRCARDRWAPRDVRSVRLTVPAATASATIATLTTTTGDHQPSCRSVLGAARRFLLRDRSGRRVAITLATGSLLVATGMALQTCWHRVPKTARPNRAPRAYHAAPDRGVIRSDATSSPIRFRVEGTLLPPTSSVQRLHP